MKIFLLFVVFLVSFTHFISAITDEDCVRLANENPLKLNRYYEKHENDCNKYYQCGRYGLVEFNCPESLHFDSVLHVCGRPREVTC
ncbi:hypothetical protein PVAND_008864 [Polypedilum vanderplanki]|uniref:Chitin-binding type-2 domain-containing protein n=1 Tax=Polypedilum vanderplanki TaxID=319348 RepID=A0A9J6CBJ6_POLVA|nr:hypothetical protein PVAND_008864 [Polypedilum vanderplanki]